MKLMPKVHELKCAEPHYTEVASGRKRFELRFNNRDFRVGDFLDLRSLVSGAITRVEVLHMLGDEELFALFGFSSLAPGFVIMSIRLTGWEGRHELPCL
jgi:hypothetical protein